MTESTSLLHSFKECSKEHCHHHNEYCNYLQVNQMYIYQPNKDYLTQLTIYKTKSFQNPYVIVKRSSVIIILQQPSQSIAITSISNDINKQWYYIYSVGFDGWIFIPNEIHHNLSLKKYIFKHVSYIRRYIVILVEYSNDM